MPTVENLTTFAPLVERAREFDSHKHDTTLESHELYFDVDGGLVLASSAGSVKLGLEDLALNQLGGRLGPHFWEGTGRALPGDFYRQLYKGFPGQFASLSNALLDQHEGKVMVRGYDNQARAILSDRYAALDNLELVEMMAEVMDGLEYTIIESGQYYDRNDGLRRDEMALRVVCKNFDLPDGAYGTGFMIRNAETGGGASEIRPLIMRHSCLNSVILKLGADGQELGMRQTHRGARKAKLMMMAAMVAECLPMAEEGLIKWLDAQRLQIDLRGVIERLGTEQGWSEEVRLRVAEGSEGSHTIAGLANGITWAAHEVEVPMNERVAMESFAASVILKPKMAMPAGRR